MSAEVLTNLIQDKKWIDLLLPIDSNEIYFFKSKYSDLFFLGFDFCDKTEAGPKALVGNFEGNHKELTFKSWIYFFKGQLNFQIDQQYFSTLKNSEKKNGFKLEIESIDNEETFEQWDQMINLAKIQFNQNQFDKIVLSRNKKVKFNKFEWQAFVSQLLCLNNNADETYFIFYKENKDMFFSLSPEKLFSIENSELSTMALASSIPVNSNADENLKNEQILLNDPKLIKEHQIVTKTIVEDLIKLGLSPKISEIEIMKLNYIMHRQQNIFVTINNMNELDLIKVLHPTPAVGTRPKNDEVKIINQIENHPRHFYAAPFGVSYNQTCDYAVALRSASFRNDLLTIHAGCGIIDQSNSLHEWDETENKMQPILKAIL